MPDDLDLISRFAHHADQAAFEQFVSCNARWLFAAAYRQLRDASLAEDAVQAVFILAVQRSAKVAQTQNVPGWLFQTLQYVINNIRRSESARRRRETRAARATARQRETAMNPSNDLSERLDAAVAKLPARYRDALLLRFYRELDFSQIAPLLGTTEAAARKRVDRAVALLRQQLGAGFSAAAMTATVAHGSAFAPAHLGETAARVAIHAKAASTIPATLATATKGTVIVMMGTKLKLAAAVVLAAAILVPSAVILTKWITAPSPASPSITAGSGVGTFTVSPATTAIVAPLQPDGTPDYVAAINQKYSRGISPPDNAFVAWMEVTGGDENPEAARMKNDLARMCGATLPASHLQYLSHPRIVASMGMQEDPTAAFADLNAQRLVWREAEYPTAAAWILQNAAFLDAMARVWQRPKYWYPAISDDTGTLMRVALPSVGVMRDVGGALIARALLRLGHGDFDGFLSDLQTARRIAQRLTSSYTSFETLVGYALDGQVSTAIGAAAATGRLTTSQCTQLAKMLDDARPMGSLADKVDCNGRWEVLDAELMIATGRVVELQGSRAEWGLDIHWGDYDSVNPEAVKWDHVLRDTNAFFDGEVAAIKQPTRAQARKAMTNVRAKYGVDGRRPQDLTRNRGETPEAYTSRVEAGILAMLPPDLGGAPEIERETRMREEMARTMVAAAQYRAEKGTWPNALSDLVPEYLRKVPIDVYSKGASDPIRYTRSDDRIRVYSVGRNGTGGEGAARLGGDVVVVGKLRPILGPTN